MNSRGGDASSAALPSDTTETESRQGAEERSGTRLLPPLSRDGLRHVQVPMTEPKCCGKPGPIPAQRPYTTPARSMGRPATAAIVVNPVSGKKKGLKILEKVRPIFERNGVRVEVIRTERAGHARDIARDYRVRGDPSRTALVVIGGDGSLHELINGVMDRDESLVGPAPIVGVVPGGTGNALALDLGVSDPEEAARVICAGMAREIDLHHVVHSVDSQAVYSMNLVIWGIGSEANITAEKLRWMGPLRYDVGAFVNIMKGRPHACTLRIDGVVIDGDVPVVDIQLNQYAGNSMRFAPHARVDDGLIDVVYIEKCGRLRLLNLLGLLGKGTHVLAPEVHYVQCEEITLTTPTPEHVVIDGENGGTTPITIRSVPRAIRIFTREH